MGPRRWLIMVLLLLTACTMKPIYNNLYWLVPWYLEDYVTLDSDQEQQVRDSLREFLRQHRAEQIPLYSEYLRSIKPALQGADKQQVWQYYHRLQELWDGLRELLAPPVIALLQSLTAEQQLEVFENLAEHNAQQREKLQHSDISWMEQHRERTISLIEYFLEELTEPQLAIVTEYLSQRKQANTSWIDNREKWQQLLQDALRIGDVAAINHLLLHSQDYWTAEYRSVVEHNRQLAVRMISQLSYTLTPDQQQYLGQELDDLAIELDDL